MSWRIASARATGSAGGTSQPVTPWSTTSGKAGAVVAMTGTPQAIASAAGRPNPSYREGETASSARL